MSLNKLAKLLLTIIIRISIIAGIPVLVLPTMSLGRRIRTSKLVNTIKWWRELVAGNKTIRETISIMSLISWQKEKFTKKRLLPRVRRRERSKKEAIKKIKMYWKS